MTLERATTSSVGDTLSSRDFDYGVGDDLRQFEERIRSQVADRIRQAARLDPTTSWSERQAYERAAQIALDLR